MWFMSLIPALWKEKQVAEFKINLVYRVQDFQAYTEKPCLGNYKNCFIKLPQSVFSKCLRDHLTSPLPLLRLRLRAKEISQRLRVISVFKVWLWISHIRCTCSCNDCVLAWVSSMYLKSKDYKLFGPSKMSRFSPAPKVHPLNNNCCEIKWESLEPIEGDPIVYCLQHWKKKG